MTEEEWIHTLKSDAFSLQGRFVNSSNFTFLGMVAQESGSPIPVVYKPVRGESPLWDFPGQPLAKREVAAYLTSQLLGWDLVPATIFRRQKLPYGAGMLQRYVEHDPSYHYFNFSAEDRRLLQHVAVFDQLINNADRKGSHLLVDREHHIWCIDHGVCFHTEDKLRTVIWDFAGQAIPEDIVCDLTRFLEQERYIRWTLKPYLTPAEIDCLLQRGEDLVRTAIFRTPDDQRRMFPYPPL